MPGKFFVASIFGPTNNFKEDQRVTEIHKKDPLGHKKEKKRWAENLFAKRREYWKRGEIVEVYSRSANSWILGTVNNIGHDEEGEFLEIHYYRNGKDMIKYLGRNDP